MLSKASHEKVVLGICWYLKGTLDEGLILKPSEKLKVDCYADADYGDLFGVEDSWTLCVQGPELIAH
jgi:hypothetical protein